MLYWLSGSLKSKIEWQWIVNCVCFCECFRDAESEGGAPSKDNTDVFGERRDPNALKVWSLNVLWFNDCLRVYFEGLLMGCAFCFTVMDVIVGTFTEDGYWTSLGNGFEAWEACWCWRRLIMYYNLSFFYSIWLHLYFDFVRPVSEYRELVSVCNRRGFTPGILWD